MKAVAWYVFVWSELSGHYFAEFVEVVRVVIILTTDKKRIVIFEILFSCLARGFVSATKYKVHGFLLIVEVLSF